MSTYFRPTVLFAKVQSDPGGALGLAVVLILLLLDCVTPFYWHLFIGHVHRGIRNYSTSRQIFMPVILGDSEWGGREAGRFGILFTFFFSAPMHGLVLLGAPALSASFFFHLFNEEFDLSEKYWDAMWIIAYILGLLSVVAWGLANPKECFHGRLILLKEHVERLIGGGVTLISSPQELIGKWDATQYLPEEAQEPIFVYVLQSDGKVQRTTRAGEDSHHGSWWLGRDGRLHLHIMAKAAAGISDKVISSIPLGWSKLRDRKREFLYDFAFKCSDGQIVLLNADRRRVKILQKHVSTLPP